MKILAVNLFTGEGVILLGSSTLRQWEFRHLHNSMFVLITALVILSTLLCAQAQDYGTTDADELQALFEVLKGINPETDWKTQIPEPCSGWSESIFCEPDNVTGEYHVTDLKFGYLSNEFDLVGCSEHDSILHPSVGKLKFLETLQIFNCFVDTVASIPDEIGQLRDSLQVLVLQDNPGLGGTLPYDFGHLTGLERLVISMTNIGGSIPESLGNLINLQQLDLSRNQFKGSIPVSLNSLERLKILDLSYNELSGGLPSLDGLQNLLKMVLRGNHLSGSIPGEISLSRSLLLLDLSFNNFAGGVPPSFSDLKSLEDLYLGHNDMGTSLPDFLDMLPALSRVDLAHSGYEGEIPSSFGKIAKLRVLILKENQISGMIPTSLQSLRYLYELDLSSNNLTGPIPFATKFLEKMGSNLIILNNTGLCIPLSTTEVVPIDHRSLGVDLCLNASYANPYSGLEAQSPMEDGGGSQTIHSSQAPDLPQCFLPLLSALLSFAIL